MTNLPQYPESLDYDELAYNNLRQFFVMGKYAFNEVRTALGSREFGKDWVVEKLDENRRNTGIEFFIQSKTTNEVEKESHISVDIETKTINYLATKTVPVFIHVLQREQYIGYLIDFHEWYNTNFSSKWNDKQGKVTVKIPNEQKLSDDLVNEIVKKVSDENYRARIRKAADLFNIHNPDFRVSSPEFYENNFIAIMDPKHLNANFTIGVDEIGNEAIRKVLEEGYSATFPLLEDNSPSPFESVFIPTGETIVTMIPHIPQETLSFDIILFDDKENITDQYEDVTFRIVRPGSKEREMWGQAKDVPIIFSLTTQHNETRPDISKAQFGFFCSESSNYAGIKAYFEIHDKWTTSTRIILRHAKNKNKAAEFSITNLPPINETIRRYII